MKISSTEEGYNYFEADKLADVEISCSDCPICFSALSEIIDLESETDKIEQDSLIISYLGTLFLIFSYFKRVTIYRLSRLRAIIFFI